MITPSLSWNKSRRVVRTDLDTGAESQVKSCLVQARVCCTRQTQQWIGEIRMLLGIVQYQGTRLRKMKSDLGRNCWCKTSTLWPLQREQKTIDFCRRKWDCEESESILWSPDFRWKDMEGVEYYLRSSFDCWWCSCKQFMTMIYSHNSTNGSEACLFLKNYFIVFVFYDRDLFHHHLSFSQAIPFSQRTIYICLRLSETATRC